MPSDGAQGGYQPRRPLPSPTSVVNPYAPTRPQRNMGGAPASQPRARLAGPPTPNLTHEQQPDYYDPRSVNDRTGFYPPMSAAPYQRAAAHDNNAYNLQALQQQQYAAAQQQPQGPAGPGGGSSGGGGGGGGGAAAPDRAAYDAYAAQMMLLINGMAQPPAAQTNPLTAMINPAVDADIKNARAAYAGIADRISMDDPYLKMIAQAPQLQGDMAQFLQGQGVGGADYGKAVDYANAQLGAGTSNWNSYAQAAGTNHVAGQQGQRDITTLQGENIAQGLEGQRTQLQALAAVQQQQMDQRAQEAQYAAQQQRAQALMQLLGTGLQYGAAPDMSGVH